jgi:AcrR family transcriptional regulator
MARRTTDETRQLLLDVGTRMVYERGVDVGVTHIKLADVVAAAGLTTGAAYRCWENQEAFHQDLAVAAVLWRDGPPNAVTVDHIAELIDERAPLAEVIRAAIEPNLFRYPENTEFLTTIGLRACGPTDEALAEAGRQRLETAIESYIDLYRGLAELYGRRVRPPFTMRHVALMLAALSEGFALQAMTGMPHPDVERTDLPPGVGSAWPLLACAVEAVVEQFTEPCEPSEPGDQDTGDQDADAAQP